MKNAIRYIGIALTAVLLLGASPARAVPVWEGIFQSDGGGGGWTSDSSSGIFHLFVIAGTSASGAFLNGAGVDQALPGQALGPGTYQYALVGNNNSQGPASIFLRFTGDAFILSVAEGGTATHNYGGYNVTVSNYDFTGSASTAFLDAADGTVNGIFNRVTNHFVGTVGPEGLHPDSFATFTITVVPVPGTLALLAVAGIAAFGVRRRQA